MPKLRVVVPYHSNRGLFQAGAELELTQEEVDWFLTDSPDSFEVVGKSPAAPPKHKMVGDPPVAKMTVSQLRAELKARGMSTKGNKAELLKRLSNG